MLRRIALTRPDIWKYLALCWHYDRVTHAGINPKGTGMSSDRDSLPGQSTPYLSHVERRIEAITLHMCSYSELISIFMVDSGSEAVGHRIRRHPSRLGRHPPALLRLYWVCCA